MKITRRKLSLDEIDCVAGGPNWNQLPPDPTSPPPLPPLPNNDPPPFPSPGSGGGGSGGGTPIIEIDVGGGEPLPPVQPN